MKEFKKTTPSKNNPQIKDQQSESAVVESTSQKQNFGSKFDYFKKGLNKIPKRYKPVIIVLILILLIELILVFSSVLKLDSFLYPSQVTGTVTNVNGQAIENAQVCIDDNCVSTDTNGKYQFLKVRSGAVAIEVDVDTYEPLSQSVNLSRGENTVNLKLTLSGYASVSGKLVSDNSLLTDGLKITVGDTTIEASSSGTFTSNEIPLGKYNLVIESPNYKDRNIEFELNDESDMNLGDIKLKPAMDIYLVTSDWISRGKLADVVATFKANKVTSDADGALLIKDLNVDSDVSLRLSKNGYNQKTLNYTDLAQGLNEKGTVEMVKAGKVVYVSQRTGVSNVYIANYDKSDEKKLSDRGSSSSPFLSSNGTVYFLSDRDNQLVNNNKISLLYSTSANGGPINKISQTTYPGIDFGVGNYNIKAGKVVDVVYNYGGYNQILFGDLNGTSIKEIYKIKDVSVYSPVISNDGSFIAFYQRSYSQGTGGVHLLDVKTGKLRQILEDPDYVNVHAITSDQKYVLVSKEDENSYHTNLWLINIQNENKSQLTNFTTYENSPKFSHDNSKVAYTSERDRLSDIYVMDISTRKEKKMTNSGKVTSFFWNHDGMLIYNDDKGLWIVDPNFPRKARKIADTVRTSAYYEHYCGI